MSLIFNTSTGIWIFHPFVVKALNKAYTMLVGELTLLPRCGILVITIIICMAGTLIVNKSKYLKWLITP